MNPNQDRAVDIRRRALADQVDGLEQRISGGRDDRDLARLLKHTRSEIADLETVGHRTRCDSVFPDGPE